jgi:hypothetical protein
MNFQRQDLQSILAWYGCATEIMCMSLTPCATCSVTGREMEADLQSRPSSSSA